jgi:hypothetical protein
MTWVAVAMKAKLTFLGRGQNGAIDPKLAKRGQEF